MKKLKIYVSVDEEIGPLTPTEQHALNKLRNFLEENFIEASLEFCFSVLGWHYSASVGSAVIRTWLTSNVLTAETNMPRMGYVILPWVPEGETWPKSDEEGKYFHLSWKIIFRPFERLL